MTDPSRPLESTNSSMYGASSRAPQSHLSWSDPRSHQGQQLSGSINGNNTSPDGRAGTKRRHPSSSIVGPRGLPGNTREGDNGRNRRREQKPVAIPKRSEQNPRRLEYPTIEVNSDNATHHRGVLFCNPNTATVACQVYQDLAVLVEDHKTKFRLHSEPHVISITNNVEEQLQAYQLCRDDVFAVVLTTPPAGAKTDPACRHLMQALV
jgi:hypothetical protein